MTLYLTRYCACTQQTYTGQKRPMFCGCGNRYQTESELELAGNAEEMVWVPRSSPPSIREVA